MKKIFRYATAELNGFFLKSLYGVPNPITEQFFEDFEYFDKVQFKSGADVFAGEVPIQDGDIFGIAKVAGLFPFVISAESLSGSLRFTQSYIVGGRNYSERGLFNMDTELFEYYRTTEEEYTDDIATLATERKRISFVPQGTPILGWIKEGVNVFTPEGRIIPEAIFPEKPVDGSSYYPYFGEKYLFFSETFLLTAPIDAATTMLVLESMQRIRYNGISISELSILTQLVTGGYVSGFELVHNGVYSILKYRLDDTIPIEGKSKRQLSWLSIMSSKFKTIIPVEIIT